MATYQSNDYFPEGGNYKAGDIVYSPAGAPVAAWIHTGRDFVPYHKAENEAIGGVTSETDLVTGGIEIPGVVAGRSSSQIAAAPTAADIALGDSTVFYDIADPTNRYGINAGKTAFVTLNSDGKTRPYILYQSGSPVILLPSGAVNSSGQFTLSTALTYIPAGPVKVYVFAGVGLAAGLYTATFSSATVCQLAGNPSTTAGSYAGGTSEITLATVSVQGGSVGPTGSMRVAMRHSFNNSAGTKTTRMMFAGVAFVSLAGSTATGSAGLGCVQNRGQGSQVSGQLTNSGATTSVYMSVDTSINQSLTFVAQLSVASDYIIFESCEIEVFPRA